MRVLVLGVIMFDCS